MKNHRQSLLLSPLCAPRKIHLLLLCIAVSLILSACSGKLGQKQDAAPRSAPKISDVKDAVPRKEPLSRYGNPASYEVFGKRYYTLKSSKGFVQEGIASWYGTKFHGRRTSSGETYDMHKMTAAHKTLPLPTFARVTNLRNGRSAIVRINDRGPFHENRVIDLSFAAARKLGIADAGTGLVEVRAIDPERPDALPEATVRAQETRAASGFYIQVGAFGERANAERMLARIRAKFDDAGIFAGQGGNGTVHRVRIGPLLDIAHADEVVEVLIELGLNEHIVVFD